METIFLVGVEVLRYSRKIPSERRKGRMKKKVAYMTMAILVLLISVIRILGLPEENPLETQPATHLVG